MEKYIIQRENNPGLLLFQKNIFNIPHITWVELNMTKRNFCSILFPFSKVYKEKMLEMGQVVR